MFKIKWGQILREKVDSGIGSHAPLMFLFEKVSDYLEECGLAALSHGVDPVLVQAARGRDGGVVVHALYTSDPWNEHARQKQKLTPNVVFYFWQLGSAWTKEL